MTEAKSIGWIRNTEVLNTTPTVSKSDAVCRQCGVRVEPIIFGTIRHWPELCKECSDRQRENNRLQEIRQNHKKRADEMRKRLDAVIPPLYRKEKAHLRHLSKRLRDIMLALPQGKGLLLYGPPGVGKTYSMCALMRDYIVKGFSVKRISYDLLCLQIRDTYKANCMHSEQDLIRQYQCIDKLLIEDVGTTVGSGNQESDFSLRTFLLILDYRLEHCKPTFITTNKGVDDLGASFDERVASRLWQACEVIPVSGKDKRRQTGNSGSKLK